MNDGQKVTVYNVSGQSLGSAVAQDNTASVRVAHQKDGVLLVKVGEKTIKIQ